MTNFDYLINQIKNLSPDYLAARGVIQKANSNMKVNGFYTWLCPFCNNGGKGKTGDGLAVKHYSWGYSYKCYSCGKSFDNLTLLAIYYGLQATGKDFVELLKRAAEDFGIATDFNFSQSSNFNSYHNLKPLQIKVEKTTPAPTPLSAEKIEAQRLEAEYIKQVLALPDNIEKIPIDCRRGLSIETLRYFHCVYVEKWIHPKIFAEYKVGLRDKLPARSRRIIIPTSDGKHYNAVLLQTDRTAENKSFWKMHAGKKSVPFGIETIKGIEEPTAEEGEGEILTFTDEELNTESEELNFLKYTLKIFEANSAVKLCDEKEKIIARLKKAPTETVIVVEGEFDAMHAWQSNQKALLQIKEKSAGRAFIATGGIAERNWIDVADTRCQTLAIKPLFVIMFDKGEKELLNADSCAMELQKRGYPAAVKLVDKKG